MRVRRATVADHAACAQIFHDAVQIGAAQAYSQAQRDAWSPQMPAPDKWSARLADLTTWVAERDAIVGFMSLGARGYVDFAFVDPHYQGQGVASSLYKVLEDHCRSQGVLRLTTAASHVAKPFFARHGWTVERANAIVRNGVTLNNWLMFKDLNTQQ